jgi:chromosome segregation ATPase
VRTGISLILASLVIGLTGCQTTGAPDQGGLFGWDENKAKQRQQSLETEQQQKQREITHLAMQNEELTQQQSDQAQILKQLNIAIKKLHDEQLSLRNQIKRMHEEKQISESRLAELVDQYPWLNISETPQGLPLLEIEQFDVAKARKQQMEQDNKTLVEEILLLIGN